MRLTTKGRYAVTAMIDLAMNQAVGPVSLKSISDNQGISLSYLEQLFAKMKRQQLVVGSRGPGGGYVLAKDINSISIADIILAVDEPLDITECEGEQNCQGGKRCLAHDLWSDLSDQLHLFLSGIHLGELMQRSQLDAARRANDAGKPGIRNNVKADSRLVRRSGHRVALPD